MKKRELITYSTVLLASALILGCSTADRTVDELADIGGGDIIGGPTIIQQPDDNSSLPLPNDGGSVSQDDNDTTVSIIQIDAKNAYKVSIKFSDDYNEKGYYSRGEVGRLSFDITNLYTGALADTSIIDEIILSAEETVQENISGTVGTVGKYFDFIKYTGEQGYLYTIPKESVKASDNVAIKMKDLSGTTNIVLKATIRLAGSDESSEYEIKIPLVIEKNKSSSMSITRVGSSYDENSGLFIDKFAIHVVDRYGNKAEDGTSISTGVINNTKLYSNAYNGATLYEANTSLISNTAHQTYTTTLLDDQTLPRKWGSGPITQIDYAKYTTSRIITSIVDGNETNSTVYTDTYYQNIFLNAVKQDRANLNKSDSTFTLTPVNPSDGLNNNISTDDTLIVLANKGEHKPESLGGWDIDSINGNTLSLVTLDSGLDVIDVSYAIGNEYRYDECEQTLINAAASTFESTAVVDGLAYAELRYLPEMVGKNIFIYANTRLNNKHLGISRKILLHGTGLVNQTLSCTNDKGTKPDCTMSLRIVQNDSGKGANKVNIAQPQIAGENTYRYATATQTSCTGWTTVSIYGIDENKTATVEFGNLINNEMIINQK